MNIINKILAVAMLPLCFSCHSRTDGGDATTVIAENNTETLSDSAIQNVIESVSFIPLETSEECVLGSVRKIQMANGDVFVMADGKQRVCELYRFNSKGHLLNKIGNLGNSKSEYLRMASFLVQDKEVFVADADKHKILVYGVDGKFSRSYDYSENIMFLHNMTSLDDKTAAFSYNINFSESKALYDIVDMSTLKTLHTIDTDFTASGSYPFSLNEFCKDGEDLLLSVPFDNTIYRLNKEDYALSDELHVEVWGKLPKLQTYDFTEAGTEVEESDAGTLYGIFVSGDFLILNSLSSSVLWYRNLGKGLCIKNGISITDTDGFPFFPLAVIYSDENGFYSAFSADDFLAMAKDEDSVKHGKAPLNAVQTFVRDNMNPVIVKYKLKAPEDVGN